MKTFYSFFEDLAMRHFQIVHATHHKYWSFVKKIVLRAIIFTQSTQQDIWETTEMIRFLHCEQKTVASVQSVVIVTFVLWDVFLWTFGFHLNKDKHLMQDNVSFNFRWPVDTQSMNLPWIQNKNLKIYFISFPIDLCWNTIIKKLYT